MRKELVRYGLAAGVLVRLGLSSAEAATPRPISPEALGLGIAATPVAMCSSDCRRGSFYVPGPTNACYARGLYFCGSSQGGGPPQPWAGRRFYREDHDGPGPYGRPYRRDPYGRPYGW